jgi:hypothetical protein
MERVIAGGAGWSVKGEGKWQFLDRQGTLANGITKVRVQDLMRVQAGLYRVKIKGVGPFPLIAAESLPLQVGVTVGGAGAGATGQCSVAGFGETESRPFCRASSHGKVKCR